MTKEIHLKKDSILVLTIKPLHKNLSVIVLCKEILIILSATLSFQYFGFFLELPFFNAFSAVSSVLKEFRQFIMFHFLKLSLFATFGSFYFIPNNFDFCFIYLSSAIDAILLAYPLGW